MAFVCDDVFGGIGIEFYIDKYIFIEKWMRPEYEKNIYFNVHDDGTAVFKYEWMIEWFVDVVHVVITFVCYIR